MTRQSAAEQLRVAPANLAFAYSGEGLAIIDEIVRKPGALLIVQ